PFGEFIRLDQVGGHTIPASSYTVRYGSTIVTFSNAYLNTLSNGTYYYTMVFTGGTSDRIRLDINRPQQTTRPPAPTPTPAPPQHPRRMPHTGDGLFSFAPLILMALAVVGVSGEGLRRSKKRKEYEKYIGKWD
ncbi:MAG: hypothetical protein FWE46_04450, partial [Coriobacteriia bacterium]|nr:hypothetical protein [Coriobacteriia bacterium]